MRFLRNLLMSVLAPPPAGAVSPSQESTGPQATFDKVYREQRWGRRIRNRFYSGQGSHDAEIVQPYVAAVRQFLGTFDRPPDVVDLGCGDFNIGRQLRAHCGRYTACDVVPDLIAYNRSAFSRQDVEFRCLDIVAEELPPGDLVFLRQVLQHLANDQIAKVLPKLLRYRYLVLTEHVPADLAFRPNAEHEAGSGTRLGKNSGVVIEAAPFQFPHRPQQILCSVQQYGGLIQTFVYRLS